MVLRKITAKEERLHEMFPDNKRYNAIGGYLKNRFGCKLIKLSLDGGFTCPNRDGTLSSNGCIFCSGGGSGDYASSRQLNIHDQVDSQIQLLKRKWPKGKYLAYFQNYTNTYADIETLKRSYCNALTYPSIIGLAIATRPDCLSGETLELLSDLNNKTYLWVELGLQTIHEKTAQLINRQYPLKVFEKALTELNQRNIRTVIHLIMGLPSETKHDMLQSVCYLSSKNIFGVKIHLLHVLKDTPLCQMYYQDMFNTLNKEEYTNLIVDALEILPSEITIHRLTGDAPRKMLIAPKWSTDKKSVLNGIDAELRKRNSWQGKHLQL